LWRSSSSSTAPLPPIWTTDPHSSSAGSGEFLLTEEGKGNENKVALVVRTINSSAFSKQDWEDFVVEVRASGVM
jgi:hypothetical protein